MLERDSESITFLEMMSFKSNLNAENFLFFTPLLDFMLHIKQKKQQRYILEGAD